MKLSSIEADKLLQDAMRQIKGSNRKMLGKILWESLPPVLQEEHMLTDSDFRYWRGELRIKQTFYLEFVENINE